MTEENFNAAVSRLESTLDALQTTGLDPYDVRDKFAFEVMMAAAQLSPPRRLPLYDRAASLLDSAGLGFSPRPNS
jgi:hypothetical protein